MARIRIPFLIWSLLASLPSMVQATQPATTAANPAPPPQRHL